MSLGIAQSDLKATASEICCQRVATALNLNAVEDAVKVAVEDAVSSLLSNQRQNSEGTKLWPNFPK